MSFDRAEKSREVEDTPKPLSQEIGGAEVGESSVFDRIVTAAKQEAEVDPDLVPPAGGVSAAPKVSKTGVAESEEAIHASLLLAAARMDGIRQGMAAERQQADVDRGADVQREAVRTMFETGVRALGLGSIKFQLTQYKSRLDAMRQATVGGPIRSGLAVVERAGFLLFQEAQECRKHFGGMQLSDVTLNQDIEALDDVVGLSIARAKSAPHAQPVAKVAVNAFNEHADAIQVNAKAIKSSANAAHFDDDKKTALMMITAHAEAFVHLVPEAQTSRGRAVAVKAALLEMLQAIAHRTDVDHERPKVKSMADALGVALGKRK